MKEIEILKCDKYYETNELPFIVWVKDLKANKNRNYVCNQKGNKMRCLLKIGTTRDQIFYENFGCELGELFAEYTSKFLESNFVNRPKFNKTESWQTCKKIKPMCNIKYLTQHSEIVKYDEAKYPEYAQIFNQKRNKENKRVSHYATLIYCFTENVNDLQNFQLRLSNHTDFNDCLPSWLEYFDIEENLKTLTAEDKQKIKEELVYSFLFRNCFNDYDFNPRNFGLLFDKKKVTFAPNFDYGEFLSSVKVGKFFEVKDLDSNIFPHMEHKARESLIKAMIDSNEKRKKALEETTPEMLATSDLKNTSSIYNIKYACKHYPHIVYQFIKVIGNLHKDEKKDSVITNIIKNYTINEGKYHILDDDKFNFIKEFITLRIEKFVELLQTRLNHYISKGYIQDIDSYIENKRHKEL